MRISQHEKGRMMSGAQLNALEREEDARDHLFSPAEEMAKLGVEARPMLAYGDGIYVTDTMGRRLIDGPAGMWCTQVGYNRQEIADAISTQAMRLSYNSPWYTTNSPAAELAARIAKRTPGDLNRIFFTTGGSTAVDSALRFSEFFNNILGRPDKKRIIVRNDGYHGSTMITAACSGRTGNWPNFDIRQDRIAFVSSPNMRLAEGRSEADFLDMLIGEFEEKLAELDPKTVAVFLGEPLLASGGVIIPPKGYHARIKAICEQHDILYISDEVVTGFGRCGEWFASEKVFGVTPDIITFAKGVTSGYVPLGGFAVSEKVLARVSGENANGSHFTNGYTYTGHPVSCAAAIANIDIIESERILENVRDVSPYFADALCTLIDLPLVADIRSCGLVACVECLADTSRVVANDLDRKLGARIDAICFDLGLIVRPIGHMCVLSPPLIITREQIDRMVDILRQGILQAAGELERGEIF
jgi:putrescine---pyruvate transaminase